MYSMKQLNEIQLMNWAETMDAVYAPFDTFEDFRSAEEAKMIDDRRDDLISYISDAHKDAYGYRPREWDLESKSMQELIVISHWLSGEVERKIENDQREQAEALQSFEAQIAQNIKYGAISRRNAIRWIVEGLDMGDFATAEFACYHLGLSYKCADMFKDILPREFA